jgi:hypothetical protein
VGLSIPDSSRSFDTLLASPVHGGGAHHCEARIVDLTGSTGRGEKLVQIGYLPLGAVAHRWLGRVLDKLHQPDWSGPLSDEQLVYAASNVKVLLPLLEVVASALSEDRVASVDALEICVVPAMA